MCTATAKTRNRYASMITSRLRVMNRTLFDSVRHRRRRQEVLSVQEKLFTTCENGSTRRPFSPGGPQPEAQSAAIQDVTSRPNRGRKLGGQEHDNSRLVPMSRR